MGSLGPARGSTPRGRHGAGLKKLRRGWRPPRRSSRLEVRGRFTLPPDTGGLSGCRNRRRRDPLRPSRPPSSPFATTRERSADAPLENRGTGEDAAPQDDPGSHSLLSRKAPAFRLLWLCCAWISTSAPSLHRIRSRKDQREILVATGPDGVYRSP